MKDINSSQGQGHSQTDDSMYLEQSEIEQLLLKSQELRRSKQQLARQLSQDASEPEVKVTSMRTTATATSRADSNENNSPELNFIDISVLSGGEILEKEIPSGSLNTQAHAQSSSCGEVRSAINADFGQGVSLELDSTGTAKNGPDKCVTSKTPKKPMKSQPNLCDDRNLSRVCTPSLEVIYNPVNFANSSVSTHARSQSSRNPLLSNDNHSPTQSMESETVTDNDFPKRKSVRVEHLMEAYSRSHRSRKTVITTSNQTGTASGLPGVNAIISTAGMAGGDLLLAASTGPATKPPAGPMPRKSKKVADRDGVQNTGRTLKSLTKDTGMDSSQDTFQKARLVNSTGKMTSQAVSNHWCIDNSEDSDDSVFAEEGHVCGSDRFKRPGPPTMGMAISTSAIPDDMKQADLQQCGNHTNNRPYSSVCTSVSDQEERDVTPSGSRASVEDLKKLSQTERLARYVS